MVADDATWWLGRVRRPGHARPHTVRIRTDGAAPGPDDAVEEIPDPFARALDEGDEVWSVARDLAPVAGGLAGALGEYELAPPVRPGKIVAVGRNFRAHAQEMGNEVPQQPLLFLKPASCLVASGVSVELPAGYERIDMEGELVVVIGRAGRRVRRGDAWNHVCGYALGNDVSNRDLQRRDKQWTRAKGFDGFGPLGPFIRLVEPGTVLPVERIRLHGYLDDELRQDAPLSDMVFDIPTIVEHVSDCMTLEPGDLVFMGTPKGVATLGAGRVMRVELEGFDLGRLTNPVVSSTVPPTAGSG